MGNTSTVHPFNRVEELRQRRLMEELEKDLDAFEEASKKANRATEEPHHDNDGTTFHVHPSLSTISPPNTIEDHPTTLNPPKTSLLSRLFRK
jgi:hypothetical protein